MRPKNLIVMLVVLAMLVVTMSAAVLPGAAQITIHSAKLYINVEDVSYLNTTPVPVYVHRVTTPWAEDTVTWDSFHSAPNPYDPAVSGTFYVTYGTLGLHWVDVTALVQAWIDGTDNFGMLLEQGLTEYTQYSSRESSNPKPFLEICWTEGDCETVFPIADAYMWQAYPYSGENYGSSVWLWTGLVAGSEKQSLIRFEFEPPPSPGEGCTPGYWKQDQHFDSWVGYGPSDSFNAIFGVGPDITLLEALWAKGGGENALLRHATAALLNATSTINYAFSVEEVKAAVASAYATGDFEFFKDQLAYQNELGCPLD